MDLLGSASPTARPPEDVRTVLMAHGKVSPNGSWRGVMESQASRWHFLARTRAGSGTPRCAIDVTRGVADLRMTGPFVAALHVEGGLP